MPDPLEIDRIVPSNVSSCPSLSPKELIVFVTKSCVAYCVRSTGVDSEARSIVLPPEIVNSVPSKVICCASTFAYSDKSTELPFEMLIRLSDNDNTCDSASRFVVSVRSLTSVGIVGVSVRSL